jgi:sugar O-acyltransferase (sialic acid O-acetyltransferase NeuD family)
MTAASPPPAGGALVILGASGVAAVAFEYFTRDSPYDVVAFAVDREYRTVERLCDRPVVTLDRLEVDFPPESHSFFAATNYSAHNALRKRFYAEMTAKGYRAASYVSSRAFVWPNCEVGEHCFILEDNTLQPFARVGNNVVLWSGNHIGHHSSIGDHTFVSSHVVVSGFCEIGESCFIGVNATIANNLRIGDACVVGAGALVLGDVPANERVVGMWRRRPPAASA